MSLRKLHDPVRTVPCPLSSPGSSGPSHGWLFLGCEQQTPVMTQTWMGQSACLLLDELLAGLTFIASETLHAGLSALKATGATIVIAEQPLPSSLSSGPRLRVRQWGYTVYRVYDRGPRQHCLHLTRRQRADSALELGKLGWRGWHAGQGVFYALLCIAIDSQPDIQPYIFCSVLY